MNVSPVTVQANLCVYLALKHLPCEFKGNIGCDDCDVIALLHVETGSVANEQRVMQYFSWPLESPVGTREDFLLCLALLHARTCLRYGEAH